MITYAVRNRRDNVGRGGLRSCAPAERKARPRCSSTRTRRGMGRLLPGARNAGHRGWDSAGARRLPSGAGGASRSGTRACPWHLGWKPVAWPYRPLSRNTRRARREQALAWHSMIPRLSRQRHERMHPCPRRSKGTRRGPARPIGPRQAPGTTTRRRSGEIGRTPRVTYVARKPARERFPRCDTQLRKFTKLHRECHVMGSSGCLGFQ